MHFNDKFENIRTNDCRCWLICPWRSNNWINGHSISSNILSRFSLHFFLSSMHMISSRDIKSIGKFWRISHEHWQMVTQVRSTIIRIESFVAFCLVEFHAVYHNDYHGADVLQTTHCLLTKSHLSSKTFTSIEITALVKTFFRKKKPNFIVGFSYSLP